ncbi:MAG: hypothetical protein F7C81_04205 [Desulfurococcales archaeon]|nr:hypothetical protein [Desulfurococcales archaeon]
MNIIHIDSSLKNKGISLAYGLVSGIEVKPSPVIINKKLSQVEESIRREFESGDALSQHPHVKLYRKLLWTFNIDPTKTRPSSEALARRVIRGKPIPRINNIVDIGNIVSLETLIPIGLYDYDRINPPLTLTTAKGGEEFEPIGGRKIKLKQGTPIIKDSTGKVVHVYPHRDSIHSMVTESTKTLLVIAAGAPGIPVKNLVQAVNMVINLIKSINPGVIVDITATPI